MRCCAVGVARCCSTATTLSAADVTIRRAHWVLGVVPRPWMVYKGVTLREESTRLLSHHEGEVVFQQRGSDARATQLHARPAERLPLRHEPCNGVRDGRGGPRARPRPRSHLRARRASSRARARRTSISPTARRSRACSTRSRASRCSCSRARTRTTSRSATRARRPHAACARRSMRAACPCASCVSDEPPWAASSQSGSRAHTARSPRIYLRCALVLVRPGPLIAYAATPAEPAACTLDARARARGCRPRVRLGSQAAGTAA